MKIDKDILPYIAAALPPFFTRSAVSDLTGGRIKPSYLAFLASRGEGPEYIKVLGKVYYLREPFTKWLGARRVYHDKYHYEPVRYGFRSYKPAGATFGFAPAGEGTEGTGGIPDSVNPAGDGGCEEPAP